MSKKIEESFNVSFTPMSEQITEAGVEGLKTELADLCRKLTCRFTDNKGDWDKGHREACRQLRNQIEDVLVKIEQVLL